MQITIKREPTALSGKEQKIGAEAPAVRIVSAHGEQFIVGMIAEKPQIFIVIPSLKTEVCSMGAKKFNELLAAYTDKVNAYMVTTDDAEVVKAFESSSCISNAKLLIDDKREFGSKYGVLIADGELKDKLARAVFIVDKEGIIKYVEIVSEITDEANYEAAMAVLETMCKPPKKGAHHHENWMKA
jgi:thioredoxin-dependent peroxiredoxin